MLGQYFEPFRVTDGVCIVATQCNGVVIETNAGLVVVDAGPGGQITDRMIADLRTVSDLAVRAIVCSHGHGGYHSSSATLLRSGRRRWSEAPHGPAATN